MYSISITYDFTIVLKFFLRAKHVVILICNFIFLEQKNVFLFPHSKENEITKLCMIILQKNNSLNKSVNFLIFSPQLNPAIISFSIEGNFFIIIIVITY